MAHTTGNWSPPSVATAETEEICLEVKRGVEEKTKRTYEEFLATEYRDNSSKLPWAMLIKVQVEGGEYLHLLVDLMYEGLRLPLKIMLMGVQEHHKEHDPLEPFTPNL